MVSIVGLACSTGKPAPSTPQVGPNPAPLHSGLSAGENSDVSSDPSVPGREVRAREPDFLSALTEAKNAICECVNLDCLRAVQQTFHDLPEADTNDIDNDYLKKTASVVNEMEACSAKLSQGKVAPNTALRAPIREDLVFYTKGIVGSGKLHALIMTNQGDIGCSLSEEHAPVTVANFVGLARGLHPFLDSKTNTIVKRRYYDGVIFHRVIPDFMIQGGDQSGTGSGGPGYKNPTETSVNLLHNRPGTLAMANAGPNTDGSQFYITEKAKPKLDGQYSVFGYCDNLDVIKRIARVPKSRGSRPAQDVVIRRIEFSRY